MKIKYIGSPMNGLTIGKVYDGYAWPIGGGATIKMDDNGDKNIALMPGEWETFKS